MKNDYLIRGDIVSIFLNKRDGSKLECLIDIQDLEKVMSFPGKWLDSWSPGGRTHYVRGNTKRHDKPTSIILARFIMDAPKGMHVDHINHNTLDNRRKNLRIVNALQNGQNKKGASRNSKTGIRNVVWRDDIQKYCVYMRVNKKTRNLGSYKTIEEAEKAAIKAREKLMPFSKDGMSKEETLCK